MRILALESKSTNQSDVAFRFDTPEEIRFAWKYIIENDWLDSFSYRPISEGIHLDRAFVHSYLTRYRRSQAFEDVEPEVIERLIRGFFGADLNRRIIDVVEPA